MNKWLLSLGVMFQIMIAGRCDPEFILQNLHKYSREYKRFGLQTSPDKIKQISDPKMCIKLLRELNALKLSITLDLGDCTDKQQEKLLMDSRETFEMFSELLYQQLDVVNIR